MATVTRVCKKCNNTILEAHAYELGDDRWHTNCFKCLECDLLLGCNSNFLVLGDGNLICSNCTYNCKQCGKKIDDLAILTGDQAYCSNCFKCRVCKLKIEDLRYARTLKGLFCMSCHEKLVAKKKKFDMKRRQMAQLELLLRPTPDPDFKGQNGHNGNVSANTSAVNTSGISTSTASPGFNGSALSPMASVSLLPSDMYLVTNISLASLLNKQLPPQPVSLGMVQVASMDTPIIGSNASILSSHLTSKASVFDEGYLSPLTPAQNTVPGAFPSSAQASAYSVPSIHTAHSTQSVTPSMLSSTHDSTTNASAADIEEVNDSDDELNLRRMREKLERRFDRVANKDPKDSKDSKDDGAILDLIDSFSGPNTPNTIYTATDPVDSSLAFSVRVDSEPAKKPISLKESESDKTKLNATSSLDPGSPQKNILLLSPNQFHDREFHKANSVASEIHSQSLSAEDVNRPRSAASSPMAKANRQARVMEMNDEIPTSEISTDSIAETNPSFKTYTETSASLENGASNTFSQATPNGIAQSPLYDKQGDTFQPLSTPKKSSGVVHQISSPPPRLALPEVPSTPQLKVSRDTFEPKGLGLEGVELLRPSRNIPSTPAVTNLEDTIDEDFHDEDAQTLGRKLTTSRRKILLKHKRSTSGGLSFSGKFGFFKTKEDDSKGHVRRVLDGSVQGLAFTTPPLPFSSPLRQGTFRDNHARSTSDTQFITHPDTEVYKNELELRSLRTEIYQLENRRQNLLADNMKYSSDKNRIQEAIKALQKRLQSDTQTHEELSQKLKELDGTRKYLIEENERLVEQNERLTEQNNQLKQQISASHYNNARVSNAANRPDKDVHQRTDSWGDTLDTEILEENMEAQKATRLKFWRRPKATLAPHLVNTHAVSSPQLLAAHGYGGNSSAGANGSQNSGANKLSQSYSSNALQIPNAQNDEGGTRKALNSFMSKSRSTTILDSFTNGSSNGLDVPLFSSTIQRRANFENERVPLIVTKCIEEVEKRGLDMEGIYRLSGGSSAVTAIENAFASLSGNPSQDKKQMNKLNEVMTGDINAVTSALKRYFRKLPDPLIPYALYENFIKVGQNTNSSVAERCDELINRVLIRLPPANRHALYLLGKHLEGVNKYNNVNRMNFKNLSVVFAPTLARDASGDREMTDMGARNEATEFLLSNFATVLAGYEG